MTLNIGGKLSENLNSIMSTGGYEHAEANISDHLALRRWEDIVASDQTAGTHWASVKLPKRAVEKTVRCYAQVQTPYSIKVWSG